MDAGNMGVLGGGEDVSFDGGWGVRSMAATRRLARTGGAAQRCRSWIAAAHGYSHMGDERGHIKHLDVISAAPLP